MAIEPDAECVGGLVRVRRALSSRPLPLLRREDGAPFTLNESPPCRAALQRTGQPTALWTAVTDLSRVLAGPRGGARRSRDREMDDTYSLMAALEEAHHTSAIEGAVTTRRQSKELIRSGRDPRNPSERMVLNNFRTAERLEEWRDRPLSPELILEIHSSITAGTLKDEGDAGRFRTDDDVIVQDGLTSDVVFVPPKAAELEARIEALCRFANEEADDDEYLHPIAKAILLHHQLAYDHPFGDGNGRTARTLFQWAVLRSGFPWFRQLSISRAIHQAKERYSRSYRFVQTDDGDVTYFVRDQLRCIERELERLTDLLGRRTEVIRWVASQSRIRAGLNDRQAALLCHALEHPEAEYTAAEHRRFHGVSQPTAWKDLGGLIDTGLLRELRREGRSVIYGASNRLKRLAAERLKEFRPRP